MRVPHIIVSVVPSVVFADWAKGPATQVGGGTQSDRDWALASEQRQWTASTDVLAQATAGALAQSPQLTNQVPQISTQLPQDGNQVLAWLVACEDVDSSCSGCEGNFRQANFQGEACSQDKWELCKIICTADRPPSTPPDPPPPPPPSPPRPPPPPSPPPSPDFPLDGPCPPPPRCVRESRRPVARCP